MSVEAGRAFSPQGTEVSEIITNPKRGASENFHHDYRGLRRFAFGEVEMCGGPPGGASIRGSKPLLTPLVAEDRVRKTTPFRRGLRQVVAGLDVDVDVVRKTTPFRRGLRPVRTP